MKRKKIIIIVACAFVLLVSVLAVLWYVMENKYTVKQITIEPKGMILYADDKPVDFIIIDKNMPRKLVNKDDGSVQGKDEIRLWIE